MATATLLRAATRGLLRKVPRSSGVQTLSLWSSVAILRPQARLATVRLLATAPSPAPPASETEKSDENAASVKASRPSAVKPTRGNFMRQSKDPETFVSVYENNQTTHIRLMAVFSLSQAVYWTALSADAFLAPALGVPSRLTPSPEMLEGISDTMGFYTDPAWILFGGLTSIACSVLTRLYAHANIGRMAIKDASGELQLRGHTFFGNLKGPETFAIRDVEITAPSQRQRYYMVKVPTKSWNMLLDSKGDFFDLYQAAAGTDPTSGQEAVDTHRRSVMTRLGVSYGGVGLSGNVLPGSTATSASDNSGSTADTTEDSAPGPKSMQPPSLEEIRAARLKRQGRKL